MVHALPWPSQMEGRVLTRGAKPCLVPTIKRGCREVRSTGDPQGSLGVTASRRRHQTTPFCGDASYASHVARIAHQHHLRAAPREERRTSALYTVQRRDGHGPREAHARVSCVCAARARIRSTLRESAAGVRDACGCCARREARLKAALGERGVRQRQNSGRRRPSRCVPRCVEIDMVDG